MPNQIALIERFDKEFGNCSEICLQVCHPQDKEKLLNFVASEKERLVEEIEKIKTYSHREFAESKVGLFLKLEDVLTLIRSHE